MVIVIIVIVKLKKKKTTMNLGNYQGEGDEVIMDGGSPEVIKSIFE